MLPFAIHSAVLFLNPFPKPKSKSDIHIITVDKASHIPYNSEDTYPIVTGISTKEISIEHALIIDAPKIFRTTTVVRGESNLRCLILSVIFIN